MPMTLADIQDMMVGALSNDIDQLCEADPSKAAEYTQRFIHTYPELSNALYILSGLRQINLTTNLSKSRHTIN